MRIQSILCASAYAQGWLLAAVTIARAAAPDPVPAPVTFERGIRTILQAHCVACHSSGGTAPMPLVSYDDVRPWGRAIKTQVLERRMPVWQAAHGYGAFAHDPSLTAAEMTAIATWVDAGLPREASPGAGPSMANPAVSIFRLNSTRFSIPASASRGQVSVESAWIGGWYLEAGDPLITSAAFTSADGAPIGTWVAGDLPVVLPANTGVRIASPIQITIQRRKATDREAPFTAKRSAFRVLPRDTAPERRVWTEQAACGTPRSGRAADLLAVRPLLADGASARVWLERPGAPRVIVGWFRDVSALYPRAYWLARPIDAPLESRVQADAPCAVELTLASR